MKLKFRVRSNLNETLAKKLGEGATRAANVVAQHVLKDTSPFVPMLTGSLDQRSRVEGDQVIYPGPYARYLYYGKLMVDPNTGSSYAPKGGVKVVTDRNLDIKKTYHPQAQAHWFEASKAQNLDKWLREAAKVVTNGK